VRKHIRRTHSQRAITADNFFGGVKRPTTPTGLRDSDETLDLVGYRETTNCMSQNHQATLTRSAARLGRKHSMETTKKGNKGSARQAGTNPECLKKKTAKKKLGKPTAKSGEDRAMETEKRKEATSRERKDRLEGQREK